MEPPSSCPEVLPAIVLAKKLRDGAKAQSRASPSRPVGIKDRGRREVLESQAREVDWMVGGGVLPGYRASQLLGEAEALIRA